MAKILVIENNVELLNSLQRLLNANGYDVDITYDAVLGLSYILTRDYDLVIIDLALNRMRTKDLIDNVYSHHKDIPFIAITSKDILNTKLLNYDVVCNEYLSLPFHHQELLFKIEKTLIEDKEENDYSYKDIKIKNFCIVSHNKKRYLTTTEIVLLKKIVNKETIEQLLEITYDYANLWMYIDSLNKKLEFIDSKLRIKIDLEKKKVEVK